MKYKPLGVIHWVVDMDWVERVLLALLMSVALFPVVMGVRCILWGKA